MGLVFREIPDEVLYGPNASLEAFLSAVIISQWILSWGGGSLVVPLKIKIQLILGDSCMGDKVWKLNTSLVSPEEIMIVLFV